jgi:putative membrane protein
VFAVVAMLLVAITPLRLALTPTPLKRRRVHQAAMAQLAATRLLGSGVVAAVVIFASEADRMVVVVGDEAIHMKAGDPVWKAAVDAVLQGIRSGDPASGFVRAIETCGAALAEHFPPSGDGHNALSDRLVEL